MHNHDYCILTFGRDSLRLLYFNFPVFWHFGFIAPAATMSQHINSGLFVLSNMAEKALAKFTFRKRRRNTHHWYLEYIENLSLTSLCQCDKVNWWAKLIGVKRTKNEQCWPDFAWIFLSYAKIAKLFNQPLNRLQLSQRTAHSV